MMALRKNVILRSPHSGRLEGRMTLVEGRQDGCRQAVQYLQLALS
jgi:hypothetical protein